MGTVKRIVCLANSKKHHGRCVAGKELSLAGRPGGWIRPVSAREHEEVSDYERRYQDGTESRALDIMDVPLLRPQPKGHQQENWLLDPSTRWVRAGQLEWDDLLQLVDSVAPLWINGHHTASGLNDKIPLEAMSALNTSLRLIHVDGLSLNVFTAGEGFGNPKRKLQGRFLHDGVQYRLSVTDPPYEQAYKPKPDGSYEIGESALTISVGELFTEQSACYKLIAAIIEKDSGART
jgi:hypothetical protein